MSEAVARRDNARGAQLRRLVLATDAEVDARLVERRPQHREQRDAPLEHPEKVVDVAQVLEDPALEETGRALHVNRLLDGLGEIRKCRRDGLEKRALGL